MTAIIDTEKSRLIKRLNELRTAFNQPPYDPEKVTMTVEEIKTYIYNLETPAIDNRTAPTPPATGELLAKLNTIRATKLDLPRLKSWKGSREALEKALNEAFEKSKAVAPVTKGKTKVADGVKTRRPINTDKTVDAIKKMDKRQARVKAKDQKDRAKKIALTFGLSTAQVLLYLQAKDLTRPELHGETLHEDILKFHENRSTALKKQPKGKKAPAQARKRSSGSITPGDLAAALQLAPRSVRITLRRIEKSIPKAWRVEGERWGFNVAHKADILKKLKGGK